jgi:hypothetical protein
VASLFQSLLRQNLFAMRRQRQVRGNRASRWEKANVGEPSGMSVKSPLSQYLEEFTDEPYPRLTALAIEAVSAPFDEGKFRRKIFDRLKRFTYPDPPARWNAGSKTFYEMLEQAGGIETFSDRRILREVWRCLLLPGIIESDKNLELKNLSVLGFPLKLHKTLYLAALACLDEIENLAPELRLSTWADGYRQQLERQLRENARLYLAAQRWPGKRSYLLEGKRHPERRSARWNPQVAATLGVYQVLWQRLRGKKMSESFVLELAHQVNSAINGEQPRTAASLRKSLKPGRKNSPKTH